MNKKMIARELVLVAKKLIAEDKDGYVYDPDHKHKPKGGGWEKTERGWSQKKEKGLAQEKDEDRSSSLDFSKLNIYKRQKMAESNQTKPEVLEKLSNDESENVRKSVTCNRNTPAKTLEKLSNDKDRLVRDAAKESLNKRKKESTIDLNKLSPELREEVEDMDPEELGKFLGWFKKRKGMGGGAEEEAEL